MGAAVGGVGAGVGRVGEGICGVCGVCTVTEHVLVAWEQPEGLVSRVGLKLCWKR